MTISNGVSAVQHCQVRVGGYWCMRWKHAVVKNKLDKHQNHRSKLWLVGLSVPSLLWKASQQNRQERSSHTLLEEKTLQAFSLKCAAFHSLNPVVSYRRPPGVPAGFQTSHSRCSPAESSCSCSCTPPELHKHGRGILTCSALVENT